MAVCADLHKEMVIQCTLGCNYFLTYVASRIVTLVAQYPVSAPLTGECEEHHYSTFPKETDHAIHFALSFLSVSYPFAILSRFSA